MEAVPIILGNLDSSVGPADHTFYRDMKRLSISIDGGEPKCPGAPIKADHLGFISEQDDKFVTPYVSPRTLDNRDEPKCPGAPLRKGHKGFRPEPKDRFCDE